MHFTELQTLNKEAVEAEIRRRNTVRFAASAIREPAYKRSWSKENQVILFSLALFAGLVTMFISAAYLLG